MNATFGKHKGTWDSKTGEVIVYTLHFSSVYHALRFLEPYPAGPEYVVIYNPDTGEVRLETETNFVFGPPTD